MRKHDGLFRHLVCLFVGITPVVHSSDTLIVGNIGTSANDQALKRERKQRKATESKRGVHATIQTRTRN